MLRKWILFINTNFFVKVRNCDEFLSTLYCLHPSLKFTFEKEKDKCLPFVDVYVKKTYIGFETSVYRKPTFTGQYLRCESCSCHKRKISLITTLVQRAPMICTKHTLNEEIGPIKNILQHNGYPKNNYRILSSNMFLNG